MALDALFEAWTQLRNIVTQKETTLIKRWSGKSANQKKAVLLKAWPGMPLVRRPDFQVLRAQRKSGIATIHALQFPHINVEDLQHIKAKELADLFKTPISTTSDPSEAQHALPQIRKTTSRAVHDCYAEFTAQIVEAPYLAPDAFDFTRLESLVEAKFREAEDHFLPIREDPGYFTELFVKRENSNRTACCGL